MKKITICVISSLISLISIGQDIATARSQGIGATVTITGIVTNGDELGPIRYIEDATAGLALYDPTSLVSVIRGDEITVTGTLKDYNGLLEMDPVTSNTINSTGNSITPQIITPNQIGENTEGELIQIDNAIFNNGGGNFAVGTYDFTSSSQNGKIYLRTGHPLIGSFIPIGPVTLIGVSSQHTYNFGCAPNGPGHAVCVANDGYQILPRDSADIILSGNLIFTSAVTQSNITTTSFDLSWNTSGNSTTECNYGTNSALGSNINIGGNLINHTINLTGLQPSTIYHVECYSVNGNDTAFSNVGIYSTASNSSGKIRPYFNHSVDTSFSTGVNAQNINVYINDTIKAYMDLAQSTLDICVYNASDPTIANAINDAYNRGVQVRYIADDDVANIMLSSLDPNIPIVLRDNSVAGIMHNKFIIIDANSTTNSWVMGGSCNWTNPTNLFNDYNNIIFIQDKAIAQAYTIEFNEMWGGVFGTHKEDNTPHLFNLNGIEVEVYFSPSDGTTSRINSFINDVDNTMEFALLSFTRDDLGSAVIAKDQEIGVHIRGILESQNTTGSEYNNLINANVNVKSHTGVQYSLHHKYAISDVGNASSDPTVLTGSHNWSTNAESNSDENTIFIHDQTIANIYLQEFEKRWGELSGTSPTSINNTATLIIEIYPSPSEGKINVISESEIQNINIYDIEGRYLFSSSSTSFIIPHSGMYFIKVIDGNNNMSIQKIIIQ